MDRAPSLSGSSCSRRGLAEQVELFAAQRLLASRIAAEEAKRWGLLQRTQELREGSARSRQAAAAQATAQLSALLHLERGLEQAEAQRAGLEREIAEQRAESTALAEQRSRAGRESEATANLRHRIAEGVSAARTLNEELRRRREEAAAEVQRRKDELQQRLASEEKALHHRRQETVKGAAAEAARKQEAQALLARAEAESLLRRQCAADEALVEMRTEHHHKMSAARARLSDLTRERKELEAAVAGGREVITTAEAALQVDLRHEKAVAGIAVESAEELRRDASCLSAGLEELRGRFHATREEERRLLLEQERLLNDLLALNGHTQHQLRAARTAKAAALEGRRQQGELAARKVQRARQELTDAETRLAFEQKRMQSLFRLREELQRKMRAALQPGAEELRL